MRFRNWLWLLVIVFAADIGGAIAFAVWCDAQVRRSPATHSDVAIVFHGGTEQSDRDRVETAAALYQGGATERLFFVGGARSWGSGSQLLIDAAHAAGVPLSAMERDATSFDTQSNVASACAEMRARDVGDAILVSDAMHIVRIRSLFARSSCAGIALQNAPTRDHGLLNSVLRAHHEAAAWASYLLPDAWRAALVHDMRNAEAAR